MARYCKIGDAPTVYYSFAGGPEQNVTFHLAPTVYYSFAGGPEQNVTFHLAPIDVQVEAKNDEDDASGGGGPCYPKGAPAIGKQCDIVYSSWMVWWAGDLSAIGDGYPVPEESGGGLPPDPTTAYLDAGYRDDEDDGWRYSWSYQPTDITETDEYGTRTKLFFVVLAGKSFYFEGQPPTEQPSPYEAVGDASTWGLLSDSCGWTGDSNCRMDGGTQPPPPDTKKTVILKVSRITHIDNKETLEEIWSIEGNPECAYKVACEGCPEGHLKLKADNKKGFCCIPCKDVQSEISQIKALLRQRNG